MNLRRRIRRSKLGRRWDYHRKMGKGSPIRQELDSLDRAYQRLIQDFAGDEEGSPFWSIVRENYRERVSFLLTDLPNRAAEILLEEVDRKDRVYSECHVRAVTRIRFSQWYDRYVYDKLEEVSDEADQTALSCFAGWFRETTGEGGLPWQSIHWFKTASIRRRMSDMLRLRLKDAMEQEISRFDFSEPEKSGRMTQFIQRYSKRARANRAVRWRHRAIHLELAMREAMGPIITNEIMIHMFAGEVQEILAESVRREKR